MMNGLSFFWGVCELRGKRGGRLAPPMYDGRCTTYDCQIRARYAEEAERERGDVLEP